MGRRAKLNPAVAVLLRRFIVVPSMLLVSIFCIWTLCGLVAFSLFSQSQHCTGQECRSLPRKGGHQLIVLSKKLKALNLQVEQTLSSLPAFQGEVSQSFASFHEDRGRRHASYKSSAEDLHDDTSPGTVASLERQEDEESELEQEGSSLLELKSLGFSNSVNGQTVEKRRDLIEQNHEVADEEEDEEDDEDDEDALENVSETESSSKSDGLPRNFSQLYQDDNKVIQQGLRRIMNRLREYSSPLPRVQGNDSCSGKWIYSYNLPSKFNSDLVALCDRILPWYSLCNYFENSGMGRPVTTDSRGVLRPPGKWYMTNQYMLEVLFHARLKDYPCLTDDPTKAWLFHIPYYGGLDVFRYHYANVSFEKKDELGMELMEWLEHHDSWKRYGGRDHFLVLGKITWDFRRTDTDWGNTLLKFPKLQNVTRLLIERDPWNENDIGVPHPTYFHPMSDSDMQAWQRVVRGSRRRYLFSFAGMPRTTDTIRSVLISICKSRPGLCKFLECSGKVCFKPESTTSLFLRSHFCFQPVGDSATRRSVFDSLIGGCIPVLFSELTAYVQYPWHLPDRLSAYSVYISAEDVKAGRVDVSEVLSGISATQRQRMRDRIINEVIPRLVYGAPGSNFTRYEDAFQVSIRSLLQKSRHIHSNLNEL